MKTRQEIFDAAFRGLRAQGFERSVNATGLCLYRGEGGLKCVIGHCIPDDKYQPSFEGTGCGDMTIRLAAEIEAEDRDFARALQSMHDDARSPVEVEAYLRGFAEDRKLTVPE